MEITGKKSISCAIKIILEIGLIILIIMFIFLPFILSIYIKAFRRDILDYYFHCLALLYISAIPMLMLVWQFIKLFDSLRLNTPFIMENVKHLKKASLYSGIIAIEYIAGIFVFRSIFALLIIGIFLVAFVGLYILSELFKQAVTYKEENDLTI